MTYKKAWNALWIVVFIALLFGFGLMVKSANDNHYSKSYRNSDAAHAQEECSHMEEKSFWKRTSCDPVAYFTATLTAFTAVLAAVSIIQIVFLTLADRTARKAADAAKTAADTAMLQASHMQGQVSETRRAADAANTTALIMKQTAERQLRAYVLVKAAFFERIVAGISPKARVTIQNFGQTPAYEVRSWTTIGFDRFPQTLDLPINTTPNAGANHPLGPSGELYLDIKWSRILTPHEVTGLESGEVALYLAGEIMYKDAFGEERRTVFNLFCGGPNGIEGGVTAATPKGNTAT